MLEQNRRSELLDLYSNDVSVVIRAKQRLARIKNLFTIHSENPSTFHPFNPSTKPLLQLSLKPTRGKAFAFTLIEVALVLVIMGLVAAATLKIVNWTQDLSYKTAYKKAVSSVSQALVKANSENAIAINDGAYSGSYSTEETYTNFLAIMNEFKVTKQCTNYSNNAECWDSTGEQFGKDYSPAAGRPQPTLCAFIDASGMAWTMLEWVQGYIAVDTNGFKKPNQWGKDRFALYLYSQDNSLIGLPVKIMPFPNNHVNVCTGNVCGTKSNYYGKTWLSE